MQLFIYFSIDFLPYIFTLHFKFETWCSNNRNLLLLFSSIKGDRCHHITGKRFVYVLFVYVATIHIYTIIAFLTSLVFIYLCTFRFIYLRLNFSIFVTLHLYRYVIFAFIKRYTLLCIH